MPASSLSIERHLKYVNTSPPFSLDVTTTSVSRPDTKIKRSYSLAEDFIVLYIFRVYKSMPQDSYMDFIFVLLIIHV